MNTPELDLAAYHTKAVEQIAEHFGDQVEAVAAYPRFEKRIPKTAITIELDGFTPENPDDAGTEQFHANVRFVAYVFVSYLEENPELTVRKLGAKLSAYVYGQRFDCPVGPAKIIVGSRDAMEMPGRTGRDGEAEDYEVWRLEWSHEAFMGESVWPDEEALSVTVWSSANGDEHEPLE
jgi:hypothetical protein